MSINKWQWVIGVLGNVWLAGCSQPLEEAAYRTYVQDTDHGLTQSREVGPVSVSCSYRPTDLLVAQELAGRPATTQLVDSLRLGYAGKAYFSLSLAQNKTEIENQFVTDKELFARALTYLNADIARDVYLAIAAPRPDSVAALAAVYPRQYGTTGRSTVLLVFDTRRLDLSQGFTLTYRDTWFQLGTLRFAFAPQDLNDLPELNF